MATGIATLTLQTGSAPCFVQRGVTASTAVPSKETLGLVLTTPGRSEEEEEEGKEWRKKLKRGRNSVVSSPPSKQAECISM